MAAIGDNTVSAGKEELLRFLNDMFQDIVETGVIEAVAESCNWNGSNSIEVLLDVVKNLSSHANTASVPSSGIGTTNSNLETVGTVDDDDDDVVIEHEQEYEIMDSRAVSPLKYFISTGNNISNIGCNITDTYETDRQQYFSSVVKSVVPKANYVDICDRQISLRQPLKFELKEESVKINKDLIDIDKITLNRINQLVLDKSRIMVLMRGCPGSGKSYLVKSILQSLLVGNCMDFIFSTDEYFTDSIGKYMYRQNELSNAHEWNRRRVKENACKGWSPIFVDNTNIEAWEMLPYLELAVRFGYAIELLEPTTSWRYKSKELARRNIHGVPSKKIESMLERFQKFSSVEQLLSVCKLHYSASCRPPQPANNSYITVNTTQLAVSKLFKNTKKRKHLNEKNSDISNERYNELDTLNYNSDSLLSLQSCDTSQDEQFKSYISNIDTENCNLQDYDIENENLIYFSDEEYNEMGTLDFNDTQISEISKTDTTQLNSHFQNLNIFNPDLYSPSSLPSYINTDGLLSEIHANDTIHKTQECDQVNVDPELMNSESCCLQLHEHNENCVSTVVDTVTVSKSIVSSDSCFSVNNHCDTSKKDNESVTRNDKLKENNIACSVKDIFDAEEQVGKQFPNLQENNSDSSVNKKSHVQCDILPLFSDSWKKIPRQDLVCLLTQVNDSIDSDPNAVGNNNLNTDVNYYSDNNKSHNNYDENVLQNISCPENCKENIKNSDKLTTSEVIETDSILSHWEQGATWDGQTQEINVPKSNADSALPKPERKLKRHRPTLSYTHKTEDKEINLEGEDNWKTVSDPISSWDDGNGSVAQNTKCSNSIIVPQPQRTVFNEHQKSEIKQNTFDDSLKVSKSEDELSELKNENFNCENITSVKNASTNTVSYDFVTLQQVNSGIAIDTRDSEFTLLSVKNEFYQPDKNTVSSKISHILMLDKGSMTEDDYLAAVSDKDLSFGQKLRQLIQHFPDASRDVIQDILQTCDGDLNWAADILIESDYTVSESHVSASDLSSFSHDEDDDDNNCGENNQHKNKTDDYKTAAKTSVAPKHGNIEYSKQCDNHRSSSSEEHNIELKKEIEQKFEIDNSHYSEHVLRIRKIKHGGGFNSLTGSNNIDVEGQSFSTLGCVYNNGTLYPVEQITSNTEIIENMECTVLNNETIDKLGQTTESVVETSSQGDSNSDSPDSDTQNACDSSRLVSDDNHGSTVAEDKITVPITLDHDSVNRLQGLFGHPAFTFPSDITPQLNVPLSVARFLYCALIEVREDHYQRIADEDEILARKLQEREHENREDNSVVEVPTLSEIMDSEMALNLHKHDQDKWKSEIKYDMATKMSLNKLYYEFPRVDKDTVCEIFHSYGNCFNDTRDVLLASTAGEDKEEPKTVTSSESAAYEAQLLEQAKKNSMKDMQLNEPPQATSRCTNPVEEHMHYFNYYRDLANEYRNKQAYYAQQAQNMFRQGFSQVGSYYLQEISHLKETIDAANGTAVSHLITSNNLQMKNTTLDLHYLYVAEALQVLDIFLDTHINHLREVGQKRIVIYIITGYGSRSLTKPRIKPAAIQRLQQRYLTFRCHRSNPGLLDVVLKRNSVISTEIQKKV